MKLAPASEFDRARETSAPEIEAAYPLVLDLDGTLLRSDLLLEAILRFIKRRPLGSVMLIIWAFRGIAHLKAQVARHSSVSAAFLPINERLAVHARDAADSGRTVIAATAANHAVATRICARFGFIGEIIASSDTVNLKGRRKAEALCARFPDGFAYAGDSAADLAVWQEARFGIYAGQSTRLLKRLEGVTHLEADFSAPRAGIRDWIRALRLHQWAKNGLIFFPLLLAGRFADSRGWIACLAAFVATGLAASATYVINDLLDLDADRQHWSKRNRAFASGLIGIPQGLASAAILLVGGLGLALAADGPAVFGSLLLYCALTLGYSLQLKRVPILDVALLAALFTMRLGIGAVAAEVRLSSWLAVFSMFLFLSLALAKRSTEIGRKAASGGAPTHGRGYLAVDAPLVASLGVSAALGAVLLMVLYLINDAFGTALYRAPQLLWAAPVLLGLWLGRVWLLCGRGSLNDDPVAFAITDRVSIFLGMGVVASFASAAFFPWG